MIQYYSPTLDLAPNWAMFAITGCVLVLSLPAGRSHEIILVMMDDFPHHPGAFGISDLSIGFVTGLMRLTSGCRPDPLLLIFNYYTSCQHKELNQAIGILHLAVSFGIPGINRS